MIYVSWLHDRPTPHPLEEFFRERTYPKGPIPPLTARYLYDPQPEGYPKLTYDTKGPRKGQPTAKHRRDDEGRLHKIPVEVRRASPIKRSAGPQYADLRSVRAAYGVGRPVAQLPWNHKAAA